MTGVERLALHLGRWIGASGPLPVVGNAVVLEVQTVLGAAGSVAGLMDELRAFKADEPLVEDITVQRGVLARDQLMIELKEWPATRSIHDVGPTAAAGRGNPVPGPTSSSPSPEPGDWDWMTEGALAVEFITVPPELVRLIKELRCWQSLGHTESCHCRPCMTLRDVLATNEVLDMVYAEPRRAGLRPVKDRVADDRPGQRFVGYACAHGLDAYADCGACAGVTRG
jgi:hypothetical protein